MLKKLAMLFLIVILSACAAPEAELRAASTNEPRTILSASPAVISTQTEGSGANAVPAESTTIPNQPTPECKTHQAQLSLTPSTSSLQVGDSLTLTATLTSSGCAMLGLPKYSLSIDAGIDDSPFQTALPEPVLHSIGLRDGEQDVAIFILQAVKPGEVALQAAASFEVHLGYPGPAYWATAASQPIVIEVSE